MKIQFTDKHFIVKGNSVLCRLYCKGRHIGEFLAVGRAICSDEDKFDANKGMKIALARAEMNAYKRAYKHIKPCLENDKRIVKTLSDFCDKALHCIEHNKEYIKKISE